ncbi:trypsin-like serine protease [Microbacterium sp. gxy059]|uniref:S1 family peptidase n=1 Tax=Microbacterium sp. gxy059 TaxID=2957199 RepID=UPI003D97EC6E
MSFSIGRGARLSALGAAGALVAGGLMVTPAVATENEAENLESLKAAVQAFSDAEDVQLITQGENGAIEVQVSEAEVGAQSGGVTAEDVAEDYGNVEVVPSKWNFVDGVKAWDQDEVVGGAGIFLSGNPDFSGQGGTCSVGFSAWTPEGEPAVITAGHCTGDDSAPYVALTVPSLDDASGNDSEYIDLLDVLGEVVFSQFGGPGHSATPEAEGGETDITVIDVANDALTLLPEVTDWTTADDDDLAASTTPISSVGTAELGEVRKSGRTTGNTVGEVVELDGYLRIEDRWVYGFGSIIEGAPGDSGGTVYQGETAVGVVSGGGELETGETFMWSTDLEHGLEVVAENVGEYTVALDIAEPELASTTVNIGGAITGTAPAGSTVTVTVDGEELGQVEADENGEFSISAEGVAPGTHEVTLQAVQGYDRSDVVTGEIEVVLGAPTIESPTDGERIVDEVTEISGTGVAGATVTLTGAVEGTAEVAEDGTWTVDAELGFGSHTVTAAQEYEGETAGETATVEFHVVAEAPVITSIEDGATFEEGDAPTVIEGTSKYAGETLVVDYANDYTDEWVTLETVVAEDGTWSVELSEAPQVGQHELYAFVDIGDTASNEAYVSFEVTAVEEPGDDEAGENGGGGGENADDSTDNGTESGDDTGAEAGDEGSSDDAAEAGDNGEGGDDNGLAPTGAEDGSLLLPLTGGALLLVAAGSAFLIARMRKAAASL